MHPARAISSARAGVKPFSNRMLPHQVTVSPLASSASQSRRTSAGASASSVKWKPLLPVSRFRRTMAATIASASGASYRPM